MKIQCPQCKQPVPSNQVNIVTDLAFCPHCNEGFKISEAVDLEAVSPDIVRNPPKGAWFRKEADKIVVGGSTRTPAAFLLVPFVVVWSGGSLGGIYGGQFIRGHFDPVMSLFGIPFVLGSVCLIGLTLMAIWGKVEVSIGRSSNVFVGIGLLGWTRRFEWAEVNSIREELAQFQSRQAGVRKTIVLEGRTRLKFGVGLNEARLYYVLNVLKYLRAQTP